MFRKLSNCKTKDRMDSKRLAKIFKALSNENRLELFREIARKTETGFETGNECFISDIVCSLNIGAPTVSHHLKELANAELISTEKRGKYLIARINEDVLSEISDLLTLDFIPKR